LPESQLNESSPFEQILRERLRWMVRLRWLAGIGIFLTILLADRITDVSYYKPPLYVIAFLIFVYNLALDYGMNRPGADRGPEKLMLFANIQIGFDFAVLLMLVLFTGGVQNLFVFYFIFHIVIGSILLPRKNMMIVTAVVCVLCIALFWADYFDLLPARFRLTGFLPESVQHNETYVFGLSYIFVSMMAVTAYMATGIGKNLRDSQRRLTSLTREIEHRRASSEDQHREVQALGAAKTEFLERAALKLKQPLKEIEAIARMESGAYSEDCEKARQEDYTKVVRNVEFLQELVEDMLEMARLSDLHTGKLRDKVDLASVARAAVKDVEGLAKARGITVNSEIAVEVPGIRGDEAAWKSVFENLLENAINYSDPGSTVDFRLDRDWQGEYIRAEVRDSGMGIERSDLPRIFDEFYRAPQAERFSNGTGMGLPITKRVVEVHGGEIEVDSSAGKGSVFKLRIPANPRFQ